MPDLPVTQLEQLSARALYLGQRLDVRAFEKTQTLATAPLVVGVGAQGMAVLFRYGVVVLYGLTAVEEVSFLKHIQPFVNQPFESCESEQLDLVRVPDADETVFHPQFQLRDFALPRLQVLADVLAKSVVLSHYEQALAQTFDRIEPLANKLQTGVGFMHQGKELLSHIGDVLSIQGKMVGRVEVSEKPELLWELPEYGRLYDRLEDEFELSERHVALERKLELVSRTAETLLDLLQNKRTLRVEWYIVFLIVFEIILTIYELWFH